MVIDVSIHNGAIDWAKVKAGGVDGAITVFLGALLGISSAQYNKDKGNNA